MVLYLSGQITRNPNYFEQFHEAEEYLKSFGNIVLSPAMLPAGLASDAYMPICFAMIDAADAVCLLEGWLDSKGARLEYDYAGYQGKPVLFADVWRRGLISGKKD